MTKIWKVSQPEKNRLESFNEYTCSQGWHGGDLSWLFYNYRDKKDGFKDCTKEMRSFLNNKEKMINLLWEKKKDSQVKAKNAFENLMGVIDSGDIIILYDAKKAKHIGEVPNDFLYHYNPDLLFPNTIFPVKYYEIDTVFDKNNRVKGGSGQGVKGIENYGGDPHYIITNWKKFKQVKGITDVFPEGKRKQYDELIAKLPEAIENSEEIILEKYHAMKIDPYINILKSNKNLVLTGAPGTGKTYLAKKIAEELTGVKHEETKEQYAFVQFHPSYDYTDFVEGLRPKKEKDSKELGFELKNGTFKEFCRKAGVIERLKFAGKKIYEESIKQYLKGENKTIVNFWSNWIKENEIPEKPEEFDSFPMFVFVIDEINRAEISKVFGELFFSIDPSYRGPNGKVKTQYANMQTDETFFTDKDNDYFFVPSNVYVLATMNDIDRSVESFDFAMRRRFAWKEVEATERVEMWKGKEWEGDANKRMISLNEAIKAIDGLNSSYHIGPAYFLKLENYKDEGDYKWKKLWDNHLKVLLTEYLRGTPKAEIDLSKLENAYNLMPVDKTGK